MRDYVSELFEEKGIDGRLGFVSVVKDIKCSEKNSFDVTIRTAELNASEKVLLTSVHKDQVFLVLKPLKLGEPDLEDLTLLDMGSENLDIHSDNLIIRLKAYIMKEYIDQGITGYDFSQYLRTRLLEIIENQASRT